MQDASWGQNLSLKAGKFSTQRQKLKSTDTEHKAEWEGLLWMDLLSWDLGSGFGTLPVSPLCLEVFLWKPSLFVFPHPPNLFKNKL